MSTESQPIQFIDGVNEGATPKQEEFIYIQDYAWVAIQYSPNTTFSLSRIDLYLVWTELQEQVKYDVKLYTDYEDNPTDIILSEGELTFDATESGFGWCSIELNKPVVVFSNKKYWIGLESDRARYALLEAEKGAGVAMRMGVDNVWSSGSGRLYEFMLRFYGRVL